MIDQIFLSIWAVALAFFCVSWLGTTHILSRVFSMTHIGMVVDILFFFLCVFFSWLLWWSVPQPISLKMKLAVSLPPTLILLLFIIFN
ncbi:hypothetical protein [Bartonella bacilliformis]|uniref:Uncharacterized protein n=1 Tax=Bartonella bacilliformis Ver097 TaxID=1293911 RepID=A0A072R305_BARBA|nr:hypothetical protein [Bartonella bacilliformis]KEG20021.1 hypothetical protein H710_00617 [Bartonella bacilliformis Ver097]